MANAKSGKLYGSLTNFVVTAGILIIHLNRHVVANVLNVDLESLVEDGGLASAVLSSSSKLLLASCDFAVGVHLSEGLRVTCETSFDDCQG
jgi:hypothetical protein